MTYNHVLIAADLTDESEQVIKRAQALFPDVKKSLVHVVKPVEQVYGGFGAVGLAGDFSAQLGNIEQEAIAQARKKLADIGGRLSIPEERQYVELGNPAGEIRRLAIDEAADLILLGTHGRHGLGLLLGSTANGVLHGTQCDVLAVRISE